MAWECIGGPFDGRVFNAKVMGPRVVFPLIRSVDEFDVLGVVDETLTWEPGRVFREQAVYTPDYLTGKLRYVRGAENPAIEP